MDRLKVLLFSFYREDLDLEVALIPLLASKISRGRGTIKIECVDSNHFFRVISIAKIYLKTPISLMKLGRNIVIQCSDYPFLKYSITVESDQNLYV